MLALLLATATLQQQYTAQLGLPYLLGPVAVVSGSKEELDLQIRRTVTLKSVETAIAFGMQGRTFVAREGKKLVILRATIKNPAGMAIPVGDSRTFGLRIYESGAKEGDVNYLGASGADREQLNRKLKKGEACDVITVYEFPASSPNLRIGTYFHTYVRDKTPKYDLTKKVKPTGSIFAKDALNYTATASAPFATKFDLDDLEFKVLGCEPIADNGFRVRVEVSNPMLHPGRWGWQYAVASLKQEDGTETNHYPEFFVEPEFASWRNELQPGQRVVGEYRFYPKGASKPVAFALTMNSTKRSVSVPLP